MQKIDDVKQVNNASETSFTRKTAHFHGTIISEKVEIPKIPAEALRYAVKLNSVVKFISIQADGSTVVQTYEQMWKRAERILGGLRAFGLQPGDFLILQVDFSQDFTPALWSCIIGGFVAVPVSIASDYSKPNQMLAKLYHIWQYLDCPTVLTTSKLAPQVQIGLRLYSKNKVIIATIDSVETHNQDCKLHLIQPHELVLLLPSSGTTGNPKLIESNGQNFINRFLRYAINQNDTSSKKILLNWFPLESLLGTLLVLPNGFQQNIHLSIELLIRDPLFWLDTMNNYRVTHSPTTSSILALVVEKIRNTSKQKWDFYSVQMIGIGSELIVAKTAKNFIELLSKYNLNPNVLYPAYGMTECGPTAASSKGLSLITSYNRNCFVEIGKPTPGHSIRIVDQQGSILEEGQIGRIQVTGPSMTSGYYQAPELNRELFTEDGWINTGDLGFLQDGKLTVTGREKEIIIINARNYTCHEIELVAEEVEGVEPSYTAACAIRQSDSETDELAIFFHSLVCEERHLAQLLKQIRRNIAEKLGINPTYLIPIEKSAIPRTSTGKIQRLQLKQRFEAGEFDAIRQQVEDLNNQERESNFVAHRDDLELQLTKIWEKVLSIKPIGVRDNLFDLGGHSLLAVQLLAQIEKTCQKKLPLAILFQAPTVEQLAAVLRQQGWSPPWSSLVPIQPHGSKLPFFFINSINYAQILGSLLGTEQPFYGLNIFGLTELFEQQLPHLHLEDIAEQFIKDMRTIQPEGPYLLGGYCNDSFLAFEIAQQLQKQGQKIALLAFIDGIWQENNLGLYLHWHNLGQFGLDYILAKAKNKLRFLKHELVISIKRIIGKFYSRTGRPLPRHLQDVYLLQAFDQAIATYIPQVYPGQIALFLSSEWRLKNSPKLASLAAGGLEIQEIPGYHNSMFEKPQVEVLAEKLKASLDKVQTETSESYVSEPHDSTIEVEGTASLLNQSEESVLWSPLVTLQADGSRPPLFCVHALGTSVLYYRDLALHLGKEQPFYALQPQGLNGKQAPLTQVEDMADLYIKEIRNVQPEGPYFLGGSSFGGEVVWEMAQQLHQQGHKVALLALFDTSAPGYLKRVSFRKRVADHFNSLLTQGPGYILKKITGKLQWFKNRIQERGQKISFGFSQNSLDSLTQTRHNLVVEEANKQAARKYVLQVYPGRVTVFRAIHQPAPEGWDIDPQMGWGELAGGGLDIHDVPGNHDSMFREPHARVLAEKLRACIDRVQADDLADIPPQHSDPVVCERENPES
ncbi:MAG TPA: hypothetical protein DCY88_08510 [Cyanobacteria bacterium UBA11372]|nr:hypothetical protein [Cyanobacteria bacterium UBA11372]